MFENVEKSWYFGNFWWFSKFLIVFSIGSAVLDLQIWLGFHYFFIKIRSKCSIFALRRSCADNCSIGTSEKSYRKCLEAVRSQLGALPTLQTENYYFFWKLSSQVSQLRERSVIQVRKDWNEGYVRADTLCSGCVAHRFPPTCLEKINLTLRTALI